MSLALHAYRALTGAIEPFAPALLRARARRGKEDPARVQERLGHACAPRPPGRLAWLHGASVGEGLSLLPLVEALGRADPALVRLVTSGTRTSAELLGHRLPPLARHQFLPVDGPRAGARFLDHWRPDLAVFAESELWPNLILGARARGAKTALVSARLSAGSLRTWGLAPASARRLLGGFDLVLAQDDDTASALKRLGARDDGRLNLKLAGAPLPADPAAVADFCARLGGRPVLLAASTHPGEETMALEVFGFLRNRPERPLLVIVPRHPERGAAVEAMSRGQGLVTARRAAGQPPTEATEVYVADTLGELGLWFRLARIAFVGGSLVAAVGGHNPLEAARLGCPVISGEHVSNWRAVYDELLAAGGVRMTAGVGGLASSFAEALVDPSALRAEGARAAALAERRSAAVDDTAARLLRPDGSAVKLATPRWWYRREGAPAPLARALLRPASWVWGAATARRIARARPFDPGVPVISVGNLTVGGSGKTPVAREILRRLTAQGVAAHALSRGYGGALAGPVRVDPARHTAREVGDEPVMLAHEAPVWVARERAAGARAAVTAGAQVLVLDDAHQNPSLEKALSLVVVDGETRGGEWPFGDGAVFPGGPMREPLAAGLARADAVVVLLPADLPAPDPELLALFGDTPVLVARLRACARPPPGPQLGFAGIAKPWRFEASLRAAGVELADFAAFPDHAPFSARDLAFLHERAALYGAGLITTEKDWARLPTDARAAVTAWPVRALFDDETALATLLASLRIGPRQGRQGVGRDRSA